VRLINPLRKHESIRNFLGVVEKVSNMGVDNGEQLCILRLVNIKSPYDHDNIITYTKSLLEVS